jgi:hypothetical protein
MKTLIRQVFKGPGFWKRQVLPMAPEQFFALRWPMEINIALVVITLEHCAPALRLVAVGEPVGLKVVSGVWMAVVIHKKSPMVA